MQYSIVNHSYINSITDYRIDAECYKSEYLKDEQLIQRDNNSDIEHLSKSVINFGAYSLCNYIEFLDKGIPFIVTEDIKDNVIDDSDFHFISEEVHKMLHKSHCKKDQVLLTMAGAYLGQAAVYDFDFQASSNQAIAKISLNANSIDPYYLSTFLNSKYGQSQIERFKTGTGQPNLNLGLIKTLKVPLLSQDTQSLLRNLIIQAKEGILKSKSTISQAEKLLLSELNLLNWNPNPQLSFVKHFSDTQRANRADADYFQPRYDVLEKAVRNYKEGSDFIKNLFHQNKKTFKKINNSEYKYIEISCVNISNGQITPLTLQGTDLPVNAKLKPDENDLLVSKVRPYRGAISIVDNSNYVGSGAFTVLKEKDLINIETLYVLLRTKPYLDYSLKFNTGTSYPTITDEDILNLPIPLFKKEVQHNIKQLLTEARKQLSISSSLLDVAKQTIEKAIEANESEASSWLNQELNRLHVEA